MADHEVICDDLALEHAELAGIVGGLQDEQWSTPTPAPAWMVRDQISHLAFFDEMATVAARDPERFLGEREQARRDLDGLVARPVEMGRAMAGAELLGWWRRAHDEMREVLGELDPRTRVPWYGPTMSAASFVSARLMETWAHGQDVADALGVRRHPTDRLRHVAHLGVRSMANSFVIRGLEVPSEPIRVELQLPSGAPWSSGDADVENLVQGSALDFCLVVTQRRHRADTKLVVRGPQAEVWMSIAQAFAGPPGAGRRPGQFSEGT